MPNSKPLEEQIIKGQAIVLRQTIELQFQGNQLANLQEQNTAVSGVPLAESEGTKTTGKVVGSGSKRKLIVTVEGIHTGMTKNLTFYPGNALEESVPTWTTPHRKPVLKNHNSHAEPLGRITNAEYMESTLVGDKFTVRLTLEITDQDAIDKVLDGRYLTLSVGGSANKVVCSVCSKDLVQEGFCGHWRGRKYEGKTAHWIIGNYTGDEISFVNMPADVYSQVIKAELQTVEGGTGVKDGNKPKEENQNLDQTTVTESDELNIIDNLLEGQDSGGQTADPEADPTPATQTESTEGDDNSDNDNPTPQAQTESTEEPEGEETLEEKVARLEGLVTEKDEAIADLTTRLEKADADNLSLSSDLTEANETIKGLNSKVDDLNKHLESANEEKQVLESQNIKLAKFARRSLAERVADLRILQGKDAADSRDALISEWSKSSSKVLESTINDLLKEGRREIPQVNSPAMTVKDNNAITVDDNGEEVVEKPTENKKKTFADLEKSMVGYMSKRNY